MILTAGRRSCVARGKCEGACEPGGTEAGEPRATNGDEICSHRCNSDNPRGRRPPILLPTSILSSLPFLRPPTQIFPATPRSLSRGPDTALCADFPPLALAPPAGVAANPAPVPRSRRRPALFTPLSTTLTSSAPPSPPPSPLKYSSAPPSRIGWFYLTTVAFLYFSQHTCNLFSATPNFQPRPRCQPAPTSRWRPQNRSRSRSRMATKSRSTVITPAVSLPPPPR